MIYARKTFIVRSKRVSFLSGTMEGCLTPPLIFVNKKELTKLELRVHVIQTLIKPLLPNFTLARLSIPAVMSINHGYRSQSEVKTI